MVRKQGAHARNHGESRILEDTLRVSKEPVLQAVIPDEQERAARIAETVVSGRSGIRSASRTIGTSDGIPVNPVDPADPVSLDDLRNPDDRPDNVERLEIAISLPADKTVLARTHGLRDTLDPPSAQTTEMTPRVAPTAREERAQPASVAAFRSEVLEVKKGGERVSEKREALPVEVEGLMIDKIAGLTDEAMALHRGQVIEPVGGNLVGRDSAGRGNRLQTRQ